MFEHDFLAPFPEIFLINATIILLIYGVVLSTLDDSKAIHAVKLAFRKEEGTHLAALIQYVKHLENICSVCGEHLISINFPPKP